MLAHLTEKTKCHANKYYYIVKVVTLKIHLGFKTSFETVAG